MTMPPQPRLCAALLHVEGYPGSLSFGCAGCLVCQGALCDGVPCHLFLQAPCRCVFPRPRPLCVVTRTTGNPGRRVSAATRTSSSSSRCSRLLVWRPRAACSHHRDRVLCLPTGQQQACSTAQTAVLWRGPLGVPALAPLHRMIQLHRLLWRSRSKCSSSSRSMRLVLTQLLKKGQPQRHPPECGAGSVGAPVAGKGGWLCHMLHFLWRWEAMA